MNSRYLLLAGFGLLTACGTPQERCISGATKDLRIVDRLIGVSETNLARGYALEEVPITRERYVPCGPKEARYSQMCVDEYTYFETQAKAINLADERQKLAEMKKKRISLAREAEAGVAYCRGKYPE